MLWLHNDFKKSKMVYYDTLCIFITLKMQTITEDSVLASCHGKYLPFPWICHYYPDSLSIRYFQTHPTVVRKCLYDHSVELSFYAIPGHCQIYPALIPAGEPEPGLWFSPFNQFLRDWNNSEFPGPVIIDHSWNILCQEIPDHFLRYLLVFSYIIRWIGDHPDKWSYFRAQDLPPLLWFFPSLAYFFVIPRLLSSFTRTHFLLLLLLT